MRPLTLGLLVLAASCHTKGDEPIDAGVSDDLPFIFDESLGDGTKTQNADGTTPPPPASAPPFDWVGIIGTGQSLSVGATAVDMTKTQPFGNLKLVDTGPAPDFPITTTTTAKWATTPLIESARKVSGTGAGYGDGQYPQNLAGETPHSGMANTLSTLWKKRGGAGDYVSVHTVVGWSGHCLKDIDKEGGMRAYPASLNEASVWKTLATAAGKTYGVGGLILTHGECDANTATYGAGLYTLWQDYNTDLKAITGQKNDVVLLISQQSTIASGAGGSAVQVWQAGVAHPQQIICTGPKYQYGYNPGLLHLPAPGYEEMGEKYAEVFDLVVNQKVAWKPLQPKMVSRTGAVVTIAFEVPNAPLVWDSHVPLSHQTTNMEWKNGKGFEAMNGTEKLTISSVAISGANVVMTLSKDPGTSAKVTVNYALTQDGMGTQGGTAMGLVGSLRDSDPFVGWEGETIAAEVTNGSAVVKTATANGFQHRATKDIVTGTGLAADTVVLSVDSSTQVTLTAPWTGASGTEMLPFRHDQYNYCVHFTMTEQ